MLPLISVGLQEALQYIGSMNDSSQASNSEWRHIQLIAEPVGSVNQADRAVTTFDVVNVTAGSIDNSWTQADYDSVQSDIAALATAWASRMQNGYRFVETRYYRRSFNPLSIDEPFTKSGVPEIVFPLAITGTSGQFQARQVALTTTDRTTYPRHWGRNYWPFVSGALIQSNGHVTAASVDSWGTAVHDQYANMMNKEFFPVVPVTRVDGAATRGLLFLTELQVDDLPDVIRSRRPVATLHKFVSPA